MLLVHPFIRSPVHAFTFTMDDQVLRGMARWPNVPAVYGWLALDRRGNWLLQGDPIENAVVTAYIARNYERDAQGRWFFQNGPQRVFVDLEYTPLVYRALNMSQQPLTIESHTGKPAGALHGAWLDEHGALLLETEHGVGVLHDRDLDSALPALIDANGTALPEDALENVMALLQAGAEAPVWLKLGEQNVKVESIRSGEVPARFGYTAHPAEPTSQQSVAADR
jgi:hypothetical protein